MPAATSHKSVKRLTLTEARSQIHVFGLVVPIIKILVFT